MFAVPFFVVDDLTFYVFRVDSDYVSRSDSDYYVSRSDSDYVSRFDWKI